MRTTAVEHDTDEKAPAHGAEAQRRDGALPVAERDGAPPLAELAGAPSGLLHPRLLLGLQARAGNAAVASLIETRKPEPAAAPSASISPPPLGEGRVGDSTAPPQVTAEAPPTEDATVAAPRAGETDDELAALDAAADSQPVAGQPAPEGERELVAQDAQAELADQDASISPPPPVEAQGGGAEPGTPIEERPPPVIPDVSAAEPAAGLARVGGLPPAELLSSLGTVSSAVERRVTDEHERLATNAPARPRHPGAPSTVESPASTRLAPANGPAATSLPAMPEGRDVEVRRPPTPPAAPELPIMSGLLATRDPGLELKPGPLPHLPLEGNADPALIQQQHSWLLGGLEREKASGQQEAGRPLGEDEIFPTAPAETLRASMGEKPGGRGEAATQPKSGEDDEAASIVAQQEKGAEIQSAVGTGLASLTGQRDEYAQRTAGERASADAEMTQLEQANAHEQAGERATAKREVLGLRSQWTTEQQELVAGAQREADAKTGETMQTVAKERGSAEEQAAAHYEEGQQEAQKARHEAEQQAASERQKAQGQSSGGLLGAIGSAAQSLFDKAKQAVQSVFDRARQLVRGAIERAQQLATAVMERAHQAIVGAIRLAGTVLTAIGDRVLVAFPVLRDRFRKAIQERIAAAEAAVNKLANVLKQAVQGALNLLGTALTAAIGLLHQGMQTAIDGVRAAVHGALDFARGALAAFGNFAVLVKDIAANPIGWISNLAAAVKDGIQNYLWVEIKIAVQGWFHDKVQEVVGVGEAIWHLLQRGGIAIADVARMAWEGLKAAIPGILIALLIEKLMSLIVPAVGAILTIIQAIQAGWASLGRILQAFEAFFTFLKHIKLGSAGPLFAKAVAAGAIAAVEFVSNFLLTRLKGAASSVSNRLRALARRIGERLRAIGGRIVRGVKAVGSGLRRAGQKVRAGFDRLRGKRPKSHADQERAKHEGQEAAFVATKSKLDSLFAKGVSRSRLVAEAAFLRLRYRWRTLRLEGDPKASRAVVVGGFSPTRRVSEGDLILRTAGDDLDALISHDPIAQSKLRYVRNDPHIPDALKYDLIRKVTDRLKAKKGKSMVSPYKAMQDVVSENIDRYRLLGPLIGAERIRQYGGLTRLIGLGHVWEHYLTAAYRRGFTTREDWLVVIRADHSRFDGNVHLRPDLMISGMNEVGFWFPRYRSRGATTARYVNKLQLSPARYPFGALKVELTRVTDDMKFRKPTAFDGMPHLEWAPPLRRDALWGIIPGEPPKVREAVAGPIPLSAISAFGLVFP